MWAITTYFNPVQYKRRLSNYKIFRANLGIPLVTVELSFDGRFELTNRDADILIQISGGAVLWQKERLLNVALKSVPQNVENIAWVDCDIVFKRQDWVQEAERTLCEHNIIQLYSNAIYLNKEDAEIPPSNSTIYRAVPGLVALHHDSDIAPLDVRAVSAQGGIVYNPGLAWAAKKQIFDHHGFYDLAIIGAGDLYMAHSIFGATSSLIVSHSHNKARSDSFLRWAEPFHQTINNKVGYIDGDVFHLWHGDLKNRNYRERFKILVDFDPQTDLYIGRNGAWHWTKSDTELAQRIRDHFVNRREDG
jgi:hypothetical protein